jgi:AcrR family transcriptional regulator
MAVYPYEGMRWHVNNYLVYTRSVKRLPVVETEDCAGVGRLRQRDAGATRERLLAAAEAQFAAHGLAGSRVDEIAHAAGVNVQLIYRYFGDKVGLYRAAFDRVLGRLARTMNDSAAWNAASPDLLQSFVVKIGRYVDFACSDPAYARMGLWALAEGTDTSLVEHGSGMEELHRHGQSAVDAGIAAGVLRPQATCELFTATLIALSLGHIGLRSSCTGVFPAGTQADTPAERERLRGLIVDAMLGAFGTTALTPGASSLTPGS